MEEEWDDRAGDECTVQVLCEWTSCDELVSKNRKGFLGPEN